LIYFFKKRRYRRGHTVYQKGEPCKYVYIVYNGIFEQDTTIRLNEKDEEDFDHFQFYLGGADGHSTSSKKLEAKKIRHNQQKFHF